MTDGRRASPTGASGEAVDRGQPVPQQLADPRRAAAQSLGQEQTVPEQTGLQISRTFAHILQKQFCKFAQVSRNSG